MPSGAVLVIGGGPAGLAAAIAARVKGFDVTVVDAAHPPIDQACGEGILPAGVAMLHRLGVHIPHDDAFPLQGIRFVDREVSAELRFPSSGLAIRRTRLHQLLADRAAAGGVRLLWDTPATPECLPTCQWLIGADGQDSHVRHAAGLDAARRVSVRFGFRRHYRISPWTDFVEVHWGAHCQIYATPESHDEVGIALLTRDPHLRLDAAITEFPQLQRRLATADQSTSDRGKRTISRRLRRVYRDHTALIGDASGSVDAITGEGLSLAFHQAFALSDSLASGDLASYQAHHGHLARRPLQVAALLLAAERFPSIRRAALNALSLSSPTFTRLLAKFAMS